MVMKNCVEGAKDDGVDGKNRGGCRDTRPCFQRFSLWFFIVSMVFYSFYSFYSLYSFYSFYSFYSLSSNSLVG